MGLTTILTTIWVCPPKYAEVQNPYFQGKLDDYGRCWTRCRCRGVKGSRVQISPARQRFPLSEPGSPRNVRDSGGFLSQISHENGTRSRLESGSEHLAESGRGRLRAEWGAWDNGRQVHADAVPEKGGRVGRCLTRSVQHQSNRMPHVVHADDWHVGLAAQQRESVAVHLGPDRLAERVHEDEVVVESA
jgi:hypothetical protein